MLVTSYVPKRDTTVVHRYNSIILICDNTNLPKTHSLFMFACCVIAKFLNVTLYLLRWWMDGYTYQKSGLTNKQNHRKYYLKDLKSIRYLMIFCDRFESWLILCYNVAYDCRFQTFHLSFSFSIHINFISNNSSSYNAYPIWFLILYLIEIISSSIILKYITQIAITKVRENMHGFYVNFYAFFYMRMFYIHIILFMNIPIIPLYTYYNTTPFLFID